MTAGPAGPPLDVLVIGDGQPGLAMGCHRTLADSPWPRRPTTLFALSIAAAAIDVALFPVAARRRRP